MKRILSLCAAIIAITSTAVCGDVTIGLQAGVPSLLGVRLAYIGGTAEDRDLIVDGTIGLSIGWTANVGLGVSLGDGPWYIGARYHYLSTFFLFINAEGSAVGPELGINTPLFGSKSIYFNAFLGAALRDDDGALAAAPTAQVGLNIAL
jgi:hypothetical protein